MMKKSPLLLFPYLVFPVFAGLEPGNKLQLTIRGVPTEEQQKITGNYRISDAGTVRLPMLDAPLGARGLEPEQFARAAETAYQKAGIFKQPAIEVEVIEGKDQNAAAAITVAGQVRRAGEAPFRKDMTVLQAIDGAGGPNEFGGRNVLLFRKGKQYTLDFSKLAHKNISLQPGDALRVEQKGAVIDRWKGEEARVKELMD
jgi:polysaccharide export outer membrane protein